MVLVGQGCGGGATRTRGCQVTWHKEGSHQALLAGNCRGHVGALVPRPMVRQEESFTQAPGSSWAAE